MYETFWHFPIFFYGNNFETLLHEENCVDFPGLESFYCFSY